MRVKTVAEAWKDAGGDTAAFWGDRAATWIAMSIEFAMNRLDAHSDMAEVYAHQAATWAATCARISGRLES